MKPSPVRLRWRPPPVARASLLLCCGAWLGCGTSGDLSLGSLPFPAGSHGGAGGSGGTVSMATSSGGAGGAPSDAGGSAGNQTSAGLAGAAGAGASGPDLPPCWVGTGLPLPTHRFDFSGTGSLVEDLQGGPPGELLGGVELTGLGAVQLDGDDDYVDLPNGLLGNGDSVTILLWVSWVDGPAYWRVLDFGISSEGEDPSEFAVGSYYVALTTETGLDPSGLALLIGHGGPSAEDQAPTSLRLESPNAPAAVVIDGASSTASLYYSGRVVAETSLSGSLSEIEDVNNWLGRSQYTADPNYPGRYDELRIYAEALSACEISALTSLGPDDLGVSE